MLMVKFIPFILSCAYAIKIMILGATYTDAPIFLGLIAAGSFFIYTINDKKEKLQEQQDKFQETLDNYEKKLEALDYEVKLAKNAKGIQSLQGRKNA